MIEENGLPSNRAAADGKSVPHHSSKRDTGFVKTTENSINLLQKLHIRHVVFAVRYKGTVLD
jgi:hypothetical protein